MARSNIMLNTRLNCYYGWHSGIAKQTGLNPVYVKKSNDKLKEVTNRGKPKNIGFWRRVTRSNGIANDQFCH